MIQEQVSFKGHFEIHRFNDPDDMIARFMQEGHTVKEAQEKFPEAFINRTEFDNSALFNGTPILWNILTGAQTGSLFDNTHTRLGIGSSTAGLLQTQLGLQAASGPTLIWYQQADATYPQVINNGSASTSQIKIVVTVASGNANFHWQEFGIDNAAVLLGTTSTTNANSSYTSTVVMLDRALSDQGIKQSGQTWILTVTASIS